MFDRKNDVARNKKRADAIVYAGAADEVVLTQSDFESEEEFRRWKAWSDADYKQTEKEFEAVKRKALTIPEQNLFLNYLKRTPKYQHWYPIFAVMMGTGLRVGEATGLRWCDIDLKERTISVNHTLACRCRRTGKPDSKPWLGAGRADDSRAVKSNMPSLEERRETFR